MPPPVDNKNPLKTLTGQRVTLAVTGSIAAYKSVYLTRLLVGAGATVSVILSRSARRFVGAQTFAGITGRPVERGMFVPSGGERHVELARQSDLIVVAPTTADLLARLAHGRADDLITALVLCAKSPVLLAPAMHPNMWEHPRTLANVRVLQSDDRVRFIGPVFGPVASGDEGFGRMEEPESIFRAIEAALGADDLHGRHLVVTAGPTVEDIDPVRFLGNRSSGKMGYAIAARARARGAQVTLLTGPTALDAPAGVEVRSLRSALDLQTALDEVLGPKLQGADALIMAAAVGDYRPKSVHETKLERNRGATLELVANPDILAGIGARRNSVLPVLVGFAVETGTDDAIAERARAKRDKKRVDFVVANAAEDSLGRDDNRAQIIGAEGTEVLPRMSKPELADEILDRVAQRLAEAAPR